MARLISRSVVVLMLLFWLPFSIVPGSFSGLFFELYHLVSVDAFYLLYAALKVAEYHIYSSEYWLPLGGLLSLVMAVLFLLVLSPLWLSAWYFARRKCTSDLSITI